MHGVQSYVTTAYGVATTNLSYAAIGMIAAVSMLTGLVLMTYLLKK